MDYDKLCDEQRKRNEKFLDIFIQDLRDVGLTPKTIKTHESNVYFYINIYLCREGPLKMEEGCGAIDMFFSYFFIRKCMWSTPSTIKTTAASIKKFYKSMMDHGFVSAEDYGELVYIIKEEMRDWQEECREYNNF